MDRRDFLKNASLAVGATLVSRSAFAKMAGICPDKELTNGVFTSDNWPPVTDMNYEPMPLPYLEKRPEVVPIDLGRQLFVDPYLIEDTNLERKAHRPRKMDFNPILKPETELEMGTYGNPCAAAKDGGIWWDPKDEVFKMWYEAGWLQTMAYAESKDGIHWTRPDLGIVPGTNAIVPEIVADSSTVWLDHFTENPDERFKMFLRSPNTVPGSKERYSTGWSMVSADGIHWNRKTPTGPCGDRSTMFYKPFTKKWIYSLRNSGNVHKVKIGRYRCYHEADDFIEGASWKKEDMKFWLGADCNDTPDPYIGEAAQLYNLSAVAYESIMLSLPQIHLGPTNAQCSKLAVPKITDLKVAYSRDGYHWDRRDRGIFIGSERQEGRWDRGYVQSCGGICNIVGDELWFHYIGFSGKPSLQNDVYEFNGMHYGGSTGMAVLRRDGFVSFGANAEKGTLTTCPVEFSGRCFFVNVDCPEGELRVEVLDKEGNVLEGYSAAECRPVKADSTIQMVKWKGKKDLAALAGKPVRFRFHLTNGELYAFWVSRDESGASNGYNAAGGPGFTSGTDKEGIKAYKKAEKYLKYNK